ncbi:MAG: acriflavin resistance protein [Planctomycetota bacterium]|nr:MAG: acriflavin resistance protein [Planctomycetota bacterium]
MAEPVNPASTPAPEAAKRESSLLALAIRRPVGVSMLLIALLVFGIVGFLRLPVTLLPDLSYPTLTIRTQNPGASPEDIEDRISEALREAVSVLPGVQRVTSISRSGQSDIVIEFAWGTQMVYAVGDVREKLERVFLPSDVEQPLILRYDPSLDPMLVIGLSGKLGSMELRDIAEDVLKRELSEIDGVAAVEVKGGDEKEILIAIDPVKLSVLGLDIRQVAQKLAAENLNASAGVIEEGQTEYLVRALNEFRTLSEIGEIIIARRGDANVYLREIAEIQRSAKEKEVITRINGEPAVLVEVFKEASANLVELSGRIRQRLLGSPEQQAYVAALGQGDGAPRLTVSSAARPKGQSGSKTAPSASKDAQSSKKDRQRRREEQKRRMRHRRMTDFSAARLPAGVEARILSYPASYIESAIDEVKSAGLLGGLFAILVIFLFLRQARPTLLISIAIPTSLVITFAPLQLSGVTLNVMSLGGLALGVGMLVDTSIVVLESITRCREEGDSLQRAALRGVREVSSAVIASTLTTIAVFLPIVFVEGVAGQLFRDQALAVVFSLLASLAVSLFVLPMLAARGESLPPPAPGSGDTWPEGMDAAAPKLLRVLSQGSSKLAIGVLRLLRSFLSLLLWPIAKLLGVLGRIFEFGYRPIEKLYPKTLRAALRLRLLVLALVLLLGALAVLRIGSLGSELVPQVHEGHFEALVFFARDIDVESTDRLARPLEQRIAQLPGVASTFLSSGVAADELRSSEEGPSSARIHIALDEELDPQVEEARVREAVRQVLEQEAAVQAFRFEDPTLFSVRTPISVEVICHDLDKLLGSSRLVMQRLAKLSSLRDVRSTMSRGNTELVIRFDREKLAQFGLSIGEAATRLGAMVRGEVPTRFAEREKKIDMRVRVDQARLASIQELGQLNIAVTSGAAIPLNSVAELSFREGPSEIRRLGNLRGAEIQASIQGLDLGAVQSEVQDALSELSLPEGVEIRLGGQREEMQKSQQSMTGALLLAIFLVYVVMAAQFESLLQPFIILFTVPLALIGVVLSLDLLDIPISVVVFIGVIMLAGIVVNNAIVLVDRINQERSAQKSIEDAIVDGATLRLRPVLMTTATTVLGLLPLTGWIPTLPIFASSGEGVELRAPMAITVVVGLLFATLLTLLLIPIVYRVLSPKAPTQPES